MSTPTELADRLEQCRTEIQYAAGTCGINRSLRDLAEVAAELRGMEQPVNGQLLSAARALVSGMETCHICSAQLLVDDAPAHCQDCSGNCDDHDEPECDPIYNLHLDLKRAVARAEWPEAAEKAPQPKGESR